MTMTPSLVLFLLIAGHAWGDFAAQTEYIAFGKNRNLPQGKEWKNILFNHAIIHGSIVAVVTQSVILGIAETIAHGITDFVRCEDKIGYKTDQFIHYGCKVLWFAIWLSFGGKLP